MSPSIATASWRRWTTISTRAAAIGSLFDLVRALNKYAEDEKLEDPAKRTPEKLDALKRGTTVLRELAATLGLFRKPPPEKAPGGDDELAGKLMKLLIDLRADSRKKKDFATADRIRNTLAEIGVMLGRPARRDGVEREVGGNDECRMMNDE